MSFFRSNFSKKSCALSLQITHFSNYKFGHRHILCLPNYRNSDNQKSSNSFLKRMSLDTSLHNKGSLTVEASLVIPIFLFAILSILSFCEILRLQVRIDSSLQNQVKTLAVYSYSKELSGEFFDDSGNGLIEGLGSIFSTAYIHHKVVSDLGSDFLNSSPLGTEGSLYFLGSHITEDKIQVKCTYYVKPFFSLSKKAGFLTGESAVAKVFNGYNNLYCTNSEDVEEIVYITEYGTAYHKSRSCNYLDLSISSASRDDVTNMRNESGAKYKKCPLCGKGTSGNVYITDYGDCYHSDLLCSGLKRTIKAVAISKVGNRTLCSKCG